MYYATYIGKQEINMNNIYQMSVDHTKIKAWPTTQFLSRTTYITCTYTHE